MRLRLISIEQEMFHTKDFHQFFIGALSIKDGLYSINNEIDWIIFFRFLNPIKSYHIDRLDGIHSYGTIII